MDRQTLISLHFRGGFIEGDLQVVHGCYLRLERDAQEVRISRFNKGEGFYLRRDIDREMRKALKEWKGLWKKLCSAEDDCDTSMDFVHLQWASRAVQHLQDELQLLSTPSRSQDYVASIQSLGEVERLML
jgi:hypothetical protein